VPKITAEELPQERQVSVLQQPELVDRLLLVLAALGFGNTIAIRSCCRQLSDWD